MVLVLQQPLGLPDTAKVGELQATAEGVQLLAAGRVVSAGRRLQSRMAQTTAKTP